MATTIAQNLQILIDTKKDIKDAIEEKGMDMSGVPFTEYANKIADISGGGGIDVYSMLIYEGLDYYKVIAKSLYITYNKDNLFKDAWEHSLTVDPSAITRDSAASTQYGTLQYPNGEDNGVIIPNSVTSIGKFAFRAWNSNDQPLVIPNSVTSIGDGAFQIWAVNTHPLVIPNSVTSIGNSAFKDWTSNNQPLVIPDSVTSIGNNVFNNWNSNDQPLVIPNSVTSIGEAAFQNWAVNTHPLVIPNSVTRIGGGAFAIWKLVPYIIMEREVPPTIASSSFNLQNDAPIYVPHDSVNDYKTATNWTVYASRIKSINDKP